MSEVKHETRFRRSLCIECTGFTDTFCNITSAAYHLQLFKPANRCEIPPDAAVDTPDMRKRSCTPWQGHGYQPVVIQWKMSVGTFASNTLGNCATPDHS